MFSKDKRTTETTFRRKKPITVSLGILGKWKRPKKCHNCRGIGKVGKRKTNQCFYCKGKGTRNQKSGRDDGQESKSSVYL